MPIPFSSAIYPIRIANCLQLQEYHYLKVNYESLVDWKLTTDHLRCNPFFFGHEHHDCVLIREADKHFFARLLFMFRFTIGERPFDIALILPMDTPTGDRDLGFTRVRSKPPTSSEFVFLESVVRGTLLVPDFDSKHNDHFVVDSIDHNMFLRIKHAGLTL
ncbi:hypothetical protein OG21DRAFT_1491146 [Imleria badia]|nr:hypothetical protein OG21DRAFT_1491146 [Imleria badia]